MENEYGRYNFTPIAAASYTPAISSNTESKPSYESYTKPISSSNIYYTNPYLHPNTPEAVEVQDYRFKDIQTPSTPTEQPTPTERRDRTVEALHLVGGEIDQIRFDYNQLRDEIAALAEELKQTKAKLEEVTGETKTSQNYYSNQYRKQQYSEPIDVTAKVEEPVTPPKEDVGQKFADELRKKLDAMKEEKAKQTPAEAFADQVREKLRILKEEKARQAVIDAQRPKETVPAGGFYWSR
jgi:hypothetical protein